MDTSDPILAVSSPPGRSPRALVRISGEGLSALLPALLEGVVEPRRLTPCRLRGLPLPCLALFHTAPNSFTGQDVLELQVPGNPALIERVLHGLLATMREKSLSARFAEPGEFTQRAFMAGRVDLTRAEGIAATITAVSDAQLQAAKLLRTGRLGQWAEQRVDRLAQLLALVEAGIDFVDQDDVTPISPRDLDAGLEETERELEAMLSKSRSWSALESLPWVVLAGKPNAGKSTLFNALLGHERAVISPVAGTTRDALAEPLRIATDAGEAEIMLVDVAGLEEVESWVPRVGCFSQPVLPLESTRQKRGRESFIEKDSRPLFDEVSAAMRSAAHDALNRAELVLWLADDDTPPSLPREDVPVIRIRTKADKAGVRSQGSGVSEAHQPAFAISAISGQGLDELKHRIAKKLRDRAVTLGGEMLALTPRHRDELLAASAAVKESRDLLTGHLPERALPDMELIADAMRRALDHLGALGGQVTSDDVIGRIFATFCIGK